MYLALVPAGTMAPSTATTSGTTLAMVRHHKRVRGGDPQAPRRREQPGRRPGARHAVSDAVGTVDSFTNGTLTIKLNDGSTMVGW